MEERTITGSGSTLTTTEVEYVHDSLAETIVNSIVDPSTREPAGAVYAVSYTHLTLPTIYSV